MPREAELLRRGLNQVRDVAPAVGVPAGRLDGVATVIADVLRGLQSDYYISRDRDRIDAAFLELGHLLRLWAEDIVGEQDPKFPVRDTPPKRQPQLRDAARGATTVDGSVHQ
jgi:hypothetical protein